MNHPFPWRIDTTSPDTHIVDANGRTVIHDILDYPVTNLEPAEWAFVVAACNAYAQRLDELGFAGEPT